MRDIDRLIDLFDRKKLLRPSAAVPNIVDFANTVARIIGIEDAPFAFNTLALQDLVGAPDHLVFVLADGLGMNFVDKMDSSSFIPGHLATEMLTVFPSTTPAAMTTLATGKWPCQHAVVGWHTYVPAFDDVSTIIRYQRTSDEKQLTELGVAPEQVYPMPSQLRRGKRDSLLLQPDFIAGSVYSSYWTGGAATEGYEKLSEAMEAIPKRLVKAQRPTFTYLYTSEVDKSAHDHGAYHAKTWAKVRELDAILEQLAASLPASARLVVTADHGHLDSQKETSHTITSLDDELIKLSTRKPSGDIRVMYLAVPEENVRRFQEIFKDRYGDDFLLLTLEEVECLELFGPGPISERTLPRLGSIIAVSTSTATLDYRKALGEKDKPPAVSHHSGLTPDEMRIPLVIA
jgi:predicted AlkP superfamily pyrophosphatase or phosphodiesterase